MLSNEEAKEQLRAAGKTVADVARELKVDRSIVAGVLSGHLKGDYGKAHRVAVALGMKKGVLIKEKTPIAEAMKLAGGAR